MRAAWLCALALGTCPAAALQAFVLNAVPRPRPVVVTVAAVESAPIAYGDLVNWTVDTPSVLEIREDGRRGRELLSVPVGSTTSLWVIQLMKAGWSLDVIPLSKTTTPPNVTRLCVRNHTNGTYDLVDVLGTVEGTPQGHMASLRPTYTFEQVVGVGSHTVALRNKKERVDLQATVVVEPKDLGRAVYVNMIGDSELSGAYAPDLVLLHAADLLPAPATPTTTTTTTTPKTTTTTATPPPPPPPPPTTTTKTTTSTTTKTTTTTTTTTTTKTTPSPTPTVIPATDRALDPSLAHEPHFTEVAQPPPAPPVVENTGGTGSYVLVLGTGLGLIVLTGALLGAVARSCRRSKQVWPAQPACPPACPPPSTRHIGITAPCTSPSPPLQPPSPTHGPPAYCPSQEPFYAPSISTLLSLPPPYPPPPPPRRPPPPPPRRNPPPPLALYTVTLEHHDPLITQDSNSFTPSAPPASYQEVA